MGTIKAAAEGMGFEYEGNVDNPKRLLEIAQELYGTTIVQIEVAQTVTVEEVYDKVVVCYGGMHKRIGRFIAWQG